MANGQHESGTCAQRKGGGGQCAPLYSAHFFCVTLLLLLVSEVPGATPSSAKGSLGSFAAACCAALEESSWVERVTADAIKTMTKAAARPVSPMRIR
jgi:hypothetical protein